MEQSEIKRISQILRNRRLQLGYTQEFAAEKAGISYSYYTKIERGEQLPSLDIAIQLSKTFQLSLDYWLLDQVPDTESSPAVRNLLQCLKEMDAHSIEQMQNLLHEAAFLAKHE